MVFRSRKEADGGQQRREMKQGDPPLRTAFLARVAMGSGARK